MNWRETARKDLDISEEELQRLDKMHGELLDDIDKWIELHKKLHLEPKIPAFEDNGNNG